MKKKAPENKITIDDYFTNDGSVTVGFISEVYFNSRFFNEHDYINLLQHFKDSSVNYIVIDGVASRIDRPEFLKDEVTYWGQSYEQCVIATKEIPNREQYQVLMNAALHDFDHGLSLTRKVLPEVKIVVNIFDDDTALSSSELEKEILVSAGGAKDNIIQLKDNVSVWKEEIKGFNEDFKQLEGVKGERRARENLTKKINRREDNIARTNDAVEEREDDVAIFTRPKKARPIHQYTRGQIKDQLLQQFQEICTRYEASLMTEDTLLDFNGFRIDYAHNRELSDSPKENRIDRMIKSVHGKHGSLEGIDAIVESGHHGQPFKKLQKSGYSIEEANMENQDTINPTTGRQYVTIAAVMSFENQEAVRRYMIGKEPHILGIGGKPTNTRIHNSIRRLNNGGKSGATIMIKDKLGIVTTRWTSYKRIQELDNKKQKRFQQPSLRNRMFLYTDQHKASPEANEMLTKGFLELYVRSLTEEMISFGLPSKALSIASLGDTAEANNQVWPHNYFDNVDPGEVLNKSIDDLCRFVQLVQKGKDDAIKKRIRELSLQNSGYAKSGSVQNMDVILSWVADEYEPLIDETLKYSTAKNAIIIITGNHADGVLKRTGLKEHNFIRERLKGKKLDFYEVGKSMLLHGRAEQAQVYFGGHGNYRAIRRDDINADLDGNPLNGNDIVSALFQHDPKGDGNKGMIGAGKSHGVKYVFSGHTHEDLVEFWSEVDNEWSVVHRMASTQGMAETEGHYAASPARTQAGYDCILGEQDYIEKSIPGPILQLFGNELVDKDIDKKYSAL